MGTDVAFADIDKAFVQEWVKRMKKSGLGVTTIAIGLRSFRTIVNICISRGLVKGDTKEMFKARSESVSQNVAKLNNAIEEYKLKLEQEKVVNKEKVLLVPKVDNLLDIYDLLPTAEDKNKLLKILITQVTYLKTEKAIKKNSDPTNFSINLYPKINKAM